MSATELRQAAETLRARATAATPGPWRAMEHDDNPGDEGVALLGAASTVTGSHMIGYFHVLSQPEQEANGAYAAAMHPGVGLALADALDAEAEKFDKARALVVRSFGEGNADDFLAESSLLAVARSINGGAA